MVFGFKRKARMGNILDVEIPERSVMYWNRFKERNLEGKSEHYFEGYLSFSSPPESFFPFLIYSNEGEIISDESINGIIHYFKNDWRNYVKGDITPRSLSLDMYFSNPEVKNHIPINQYDPNSSNPLEATMAKIRQAEEPFANRRFIGTSNDGLNYSGNFTEYIKPIISSRTGELTNGGKVEEVNGVFRIKQIV